MAGDLKSFLTKDMAKKKPVAAPKKALSFDDPNYGKPAAFDPSYDAKTKKIARQQSAYEAGAAQRANARAPKATKATPAKGGPGYIGVGGKKG